MVGLIYEVLQGRVPLRTVPLSNMSVSRRRGRQAPSSFGLIPMSLLKNKSGPPEGTRQAPTASSSWWAVRLERASVCHPRSLHPSLSQVDWPHPILL